MSVAGLDVGTSGCKVIVYDLAGNVKASFGSSYHEEGDTGYRELDPVTVLGGVKECLRNVMAQVDEPIEALAIASLGESAVCLDEEGRIIGKSMVTGDKRGIAEAAEIIRQISKAEIMSITGIPASEMYSLPKFLWQSRHTDILKRAKYIFLYEDFIGYYLTGKRMVSYSSASRTMAFDIEKKEWSERLLAIAGINAEQMSAPVPAGTIIGTVLPDVASELGLSAGMRIVTGGHDQECAALGAGVTGPGIGEDGHGTCEVMNIMLKYPLKTEYMIKNDFACIPGMIPDTLMTNLEITTCGILMNWSRDCIFEGIRRECEMRGENFFWHMDQKADRIKTELLVLPQFGSAGNPDVNYDAKGLIWGLTIHTKPEEIYLAIKESMAFQMRMAYECSADIGNAVTNIVVTGGGSASDLTLQIRADVFGMETMTLKSKEAGTLGCMIAAAKAVGHYSSFEEGVKRAVHVKKRYQPRADYVSYYEEKYQIYLRLYQKMYDFK